MVARFPRSLSTRFAVGFGVLVALTALNVAVIGWAQGERREAFAGLQSSLERERAIDDLRWRVETRARQVKVLSDLVGVSRTSTSADDLAHTIRELGALTWRLREVGGTASPDAQRLVVRVDSLVRSWTVFYRAESASPALAIEELVLVAEPLSAELLTRDFPRSLQLERGRTARATAAFLRAERTSTAVSWLTLAATGLLALALALLLSRQLLAGIAELRGGAERFGAGHVSHRLRVLRDDELGGVAASFNGMAEQLESTHWELMSRNTELGDALSRLQRAQYELVQNAKMSAMGTMLAGLAHELNNPLASVLGFGELLDEQLRRGNVACPEELRQALVTPLVEEAARARDLVRSLLQFSRKAAAELCPVDVNDALERVVNLRRYAFLQAGLAVDLECPPGLLVEAEPLRLQQVFLNIVNNAFDALTSGGGTTLVIRVRVTEDSFVSVVLEDDGPGLQEPDRVFEPFYTTKGVGSGTGLGLAIVHRLVTEFGGTVSGSSSSLGGARFEIVLRAADEAAVAPVPRIAGAPHIEQAELPFLAAAALPALALNGARRHRVLVVDDEAPIRELQRRLLDELHVDVLLAQSADEARAMIQRLDIDAVVSDIKMPGSMNGVGLFNWTAANAPSLAEHFLFVTGDLQAPLPPPGIATNTPRCVIKPFARREYLDAVRALLPTPVRA